MYTKMYLTNTRLVLPWNLNNNQTNSTLSSYQVRFAISFSFINLFQWAPSPFVSMMVVIVMVVPVPISFYFINLFQWAPSPFVSMVVVIAMVVPVPI